MKALVTGGGGFLATAIIRQLVARGDSVRSLSRHKYSHLQAMGIDERRGDLADPQAVIEAAAGCDVVFHVAARAGIWGRYRDFHEANVVGTTNVIAACRHHQLSRLVYTSSPSVVFNGRDMEGVDESVPYAESFPAAYPQTKAIAEKAVLDANDERLATVALRPHLIWGPGDNHLVPRIIARARAGQLRQVGDGTNRVDTIYVDNAADAHLLAADRLFPGSPIAGKAYFISQGEPVLLWDMVNRILAAANLPPVRKRIGASTAYAAGTVLEWLARLTFRRSEPRMTRFVAKELATSHWFDISAARRDLDYHPRISTEEGLRRLAESFRNGDAPTSFRRRDTLS